MDSFGSWPLSVRCSWFLEAPSLAEAQAKMAVMAGMGLRVQAWGSLGLPCEIPFWSPDPSLTCLSVPILKWWSVDQRYSITLSLLEILNPGLHPKPLGLGFLFSQENRGICMHIRVLGSPP